MFVRAKKSGDYQYLQIVENQRIDGKVRQQVVATLGRLDILQSTGKVDAILSSCARFSQKVSVLDAHKRGTLPAAKTIRIGPPKVFGRLWEQTGLHKVITELLKGRKYEFDVERAIFLTVLHRLMVSGSDRNAEQWCRGYAIDGVGEIELHQIYRAMAWLGEELAADKQFGATPFSPRCTKDLIEESLFARRRDLFGSLDLVFFDTTSIYFEGEGGETLGQYGNSKDSRPELKEVKVGTHRYIVCRNEEQARKDRADRKAIVESLREQLKRGDKALVGNKGYRKYLAAPKSQEHFQIDEDKILEEAKYDGIWVLQTDLDISAQEIALHYKELWMVETIFRTIKSILANRPVFHKCDETIRGHVFCSFLALILMKELQERIQQKGWLNIEWQDIIYYLNELHE